VRRSTPAKNHHKASITPLRWPESRCFRISVMSSPNLQQVGPCSEWRNAALLTQMNLLLLALPGRVLADGYQVTRTMYMYVQT
jgi:hypothetical protein